MVEAVPPPVVIFQEGHVEADGFQIRCMEAGRGNPVVMLDSMKWGLSKLHDALAQKNRVVVLELPGFGSSPTNTRSQSVQDLANTMTQAAAKVVRNRYTLISTSFGANVALWQTLQAPEHPIRLNRWPTGYSRIRRRCWPAVCGSRHPRQGASTGAAAQGRYS
jgi:pimeloyl-ACP methyl ester carboxylesterase